MCQLACALSKLLDHFHFKKITYSLVIVEFEVCHIIDIFLTVAPKEVTGESCIGFIYVLVHRCGVSRQMIQ